MTALAGVNIIDTTQTTLGVSDSSTSIGPTFDVGFSYTLNQTSLNFSVSQTVNASALGDLRERRSFRMGLNHRVNTRETFGVEGSYTTQDTVSGGDGSAETIFFSVSPTYTFALTRYWNLNVGYQFRFRDDGTGNGMSNKVFGTLSREIALLP